VGEGWGEGAAFRMSTSLPRERRALTPALSRKRQRELPYHREVTFALGKIHPPVPRGGALLPRPALEQRLRDALATHRAVLLAAPAGCGKSALLVRALAPAPAGHGLAWVSLDADDDLYRLLECLLAALEPFDLPWRVAPEGLLAAASGGDPRGRQRAVDDLVNALAAAELAHGTIVVDDLHHLRDEPALDFLGRWVERLPPNWTLVLSTRDAPAGLLARAAAAGELARFDEADLRFSADEVQAWFAQHGLDAAAARALHARTEGWAAGLRLAAQGARGTGTIDRAAFDFLAAEVLSQLDAPLRDFLLDTSVLHELDAARCTALTGDANAARWLDEIERRGLFASVVDEAAGTLRLHDLFRDALQHRLRVERPQDWPLRLARAAEQETDPLRRQGLLLAAQRPDDAARALLAVAPDLNTGGAATTVLRLLDAYAPAFAAGSAEWQRVAGLATMTVWRLQESERHFGLAEALYRERGDVAAAQAMAARRASVLAALGRIDEADGQLRALHGTPLVNVEARLVAATASMWLHLERGENDAVAPVFEEFVRQQQACTALAQWNTVPSPRQTACRGMAALSQRWASGALAVAGDRPVPLRTFALLVLGWRAFWLGRPAEAQVLLDQALGDASWGGHEVIARAHGLPLQAALAVLRGDTAQALQTMRRRLDEHPAGYGGWGLWFALQFAARIAAVAGDAVQGREWLQRMVTMHHTLPDVTPQRLRPLEALHGALAVLDGNTAAARAHWEASLVDEQSADLLGQAAEVRVRLARLSLAEGDRDGAAALLRPLLERPDDGPRGAVFAGDALAVLAREDWRGRLPDELAATLREWVSGLSRSAAVACVDASDDVAEADAVGPTGERLTSRELEVVALIARGQSNKVIARHLDLSPYTVKRHVANSLAKLGVGSRGQAAAWFHARAR
jgi:LuxR family maltose regulon positive regulatory protein